MSSHGTLAEGAEALPKQTTCADLGIPAMKLKAALALRNRIRRQDKVGQQDVEPECGAWHGRGLSFAGSRAAGEAGQRAPRPERSQRTRTRLRTFEFQPQAEKQAQETGK